MKRILLTLSVLFIIITSVKSQSFTIEKRDCNITFVSTTTSRVWYSYDLYQAVINYDPALDVQKFIIGDNLRTNTYSEFQITNFSTIPIIIDSFYSWKTQCIDLHKGSVLIDTASNSWKLIGNDISSTDFLGTNNSQPLVLKTSGTEKARITTAGKVGINTNAPTSTLDIDGDLRIRGLVASTTDSVLGIDDSGYIYKVAGGGSSYYLYSENYDSATFLPSTVTGLNAVSIGVQNTANGDYSTAIGGNNITNGLASFTSGATNTANGDYSTAIGGNNITNGLASFTSGATNTANGDYSTAMGNGTTATGEYSTSLNTNTSAEGVASTAMGYSTTAYSYVETALGIDNSVYTPISTSSYELTDRLVVVGKGSNQDAFTILKNAKTGIDIDNFELTTNASKLQVNGLIASTYQTINADITLDSTNISTYNLIDNSGGAINITLPNPSSMSFKHMSARITFKLATANIITLVKIFPYGADLIDSADNFVFTSKYESIDLVTDGTNWWIVSNNK